MNDIDDAPMLNFSAPPTGQPSAPSRQSTQNVRTEAPRLRETVTVHPTESRATYLLKASTDWDWQDLQAYVATQIVRLHGPFPRDDRKECGIFKSFISRHGADAGPIAQFAFEQADGMWMGAPIMPTRFCKGSDPYFADKIKDRLAAS